MQFFDFGTFYFAGGGKSCKSGESGHKFTLLGCVCRTKSAYNMMAGLYLLASARALHVLGAVSSLVYRARALFVKAMALFVEIVLSTAL